MKRVTSLEQSLDLKYLNFTQEVTKGDYLYLIDKSTQKSSWHKTLCLTLNSTMIDDGQELTVLLFDDDNTILKFNLLKSKHIEIVKAFDSYQIDEAFPPLKHSCIVIRKTESYSSVCIETNYNRDWNEGSIHKASTVFEAKVKLLIEWIENENHKIY